jgi:FkbM family methyltransferase
MKKIRKFVFGFIFVLLVIISLLIFVAVKMHLGFQKLRYESQNPSESQKVEDSQIINSTQEIEDDVHILGMYVQQLMNEKVTLINDVIKYGDEFQEISNNKQKLKDELNNQKEKYNEDMKIFDNDVKKYNKIKRNFSDDIEKYDVDIKKLSDDEQKLNFYKQNIDDEVRLFKDSVEKFDDNIQEFDDEKKKINEEIQKLRDDLESKIQKIKIIENFINVGGGFSSNDYSGLKDFFGDDIVDIFLIHKIQIDNETYLFGDFFMSNTVNVVNNELNTSSYKLSKIPFKEGDIVLDIGLNVGMISIYLAHKYPFLKIYSFEPLKANYKNFFRNRIMNNIPDGTITAENLAVTGDGRNVTMNIDPTNSGGSRMREFSVSTKTDDIVPSITLDSIFEKYNISKVKLLKIDCEGAVCIYCFYNNYLLMFLIFFFF